MAEMIQKMIQRRRQFGFTLLEATMAMVLLAIASAGVLLPFTNAASVQAEGARQTTAANLASELMEITLRERYSTLEAGYYKHENENLMEDAAGSVHIGSLYSGFSRSAVCSSYIDESVYGKRLLIVTVTVYYNGTEKTRVTTLVGNHD